MAYRSKQHLIGERTRNRPSKDTALTHASLLRESQSILDAGLIPGSIGRLVIKIGLYLRNHFQRFVSA